MTKIMEYKFRAGLLFLVWTLLALACPTGAQPTEEDYSQLCHELLEAGFMPLDSGLAYGVPYVHIKIPLGFSVTSFCRQIPSLSRDFSRCRERIAFFNALNPSYVKTRESEPFAIEADILMVPLDLKRIPEIFPSYDRALASYPAYLLVDIGKGFLALYAHGELLRVFPVSAGMAGKQTPLFEFRVEAKLESHWSTLYDTWMPHALLLQRPYYIHGGVLPGKDDSAGCIRVIPDDARQLYQLVEVGTPGRIISSPKVERSYPAAFCR